MNEHNQSASAHSASRGGHVARGSAAVAVLCIAVALSGCGSSAQQKPQSLSTSAWASGVCSSLDTWKGSVTTAATSVVSSGVSKDSLSAAANSAEQATSTLESSLKDLGKPDTASGQQAKGIVDQLSTSLTADVTSIKTTASSASGIRGVIAAAPTVARTLASMQTQVSTAVTSLEQLDPSGELSSAFSQSPACQSLATPTPGT